MARIKLVLLGAIGKSSLSVDLEGNNHSFIIAP
ncbi:hypothetical protein ND2E_4120 [Colwellia psychrerythraea]|uniref:Uncharacterized protein n=1 Tax=Colwellia psychrerythraea TaxID=28229 RepID=A0A099KC29_COLPS|nr:hypothetical protein ND2E_4120 [Colwellia psychrerythraea]